MDDVLDRLLWEYRMDVQRFTPGADLLIDKAKDKTKAAIQQYIQEAVVAAQIDEHVLVYRHKYLPAEEFLEWSDERIAQLQNKPKERQ